jgi:hypothetical protein
MTKNPKQPKCNGDERSKPPIRGVGPRLERINRSTDQRINGNLMQPYYRDLRRRAETLEARCFPEPESIVTLIFSDEDGLPCSVWIPTKFEWTRKDGEPIPLKIIELLEPEVRAACEARLAAQEGAAQDGTVEDGVAEDGDQGGARKA